MTTRKRRVLWAHFNRLGVARGSSDAWTVRIGTRSIQTKHIDIRIPMSTVYRGRTAPQPRAYFRGIGRVRVEKDRVIIHA